MEKGPIDETELPLQVGIRRAQERAKQHVFKIGDVIAHPNDKIVYNLKEIRGNEAIGWYHQREDTIKRFPLNEIFDPNVAKEEAVKANVELHLDSQDN